jgi:subtilisin family serine protease
LRSALSYAQSAGVLVVAASGNSGTSPLQYPAAVTGVLAVGAVGQAKTRAPYSNYGPGENGSGHSLDLVAPGGSSAEGPSSVIWQQTYAKCTLDLNSSPDYTTFLPATPCRGTSMAAAHVSGVAALVKSKFPNLNRVQLVSDLKLCAEPLGDENTKDQYGSGLVRADRALADVDSDNLPDCIDPDVHPTPIPPDNECLVPSESPTPMPTSTPTETPLPTATDTASPTATLVPTDTPVTTDTPLPSDTPPPTDSPVATDTPLPTDTPALTDTPVPTDTPTPTPVPTPSPTPRPQCGDVNCNHVVDAGDALGVLQWLTDSQSDWNVCIGLGYVNCDNELNVVDAAVILRHAATLPTNLPAGCSGIG